VCAVLNILKLLCALLSAQLRSEVSNLFNESALLSSGGRFFHIKSSGAGAGQDLTLSGQRAATFQALK